MKKQYDYFRDYLESFLPDPLIDGVISYLTDNAEHIGNHKYVCLHQNHWDDPAEIME